MLAPGTASAGPAVPGDDPFDGLLPLDEPPLLPADFVPVIIPMLPLPMPPGPDDGPEPFIPPKFEDWIPEIELDPLPGDWLVPPGDDDGEEPEPEPEPEPECAEYSAANFGVIVDRYDDDLIEVQLTYTDDDVCDYTVWSAIAAPGADETLASTTVGMQNVAFQTGDDMYYQQTFSDHDLCDLEIRVAVEESLAMIHPYTDPGCRRHPTRVKRPMTVRHLTTDETPDDGETPDAGEMPDDGETPDDGEPVEETPEAGPLTDDEPTTPTTPSGGLPQTGTDMTTVLLAIGLMTLGAGSIVALATRRRDEQPAI